MFPSLISMNPCSFSNWMGCNSVFRGFLLPPVLESLDRQEKLLVRSNSQGLLPKMLFPNLCTKSLSSACLQMFAAASPQPAHLGTRGSVDPSSGLSPEVWALPSFFDLCSCSPASSILATVSARSYWVITQKQDHIVIFQCKKGKNVQMEDHWEL